MLELLGCASGLATLLRASQTTANSTGLLSAEIKRLQRSILEVLAESSLLGLVHDGQNLGNVLSQNLTIRNNEYQAREVCVDHTHKKKKKKANGYILPSLEAAPPVT